MPRPLYALPLTQQESREFAKSGNRGLWNDKFCDIYPLGFGRPDESSKKIWLHAIVREPAGEKTQLAEFVDRLTKLCETQNGLHRVVWNQDSLVSGTGRSHPLENGFSFHPTLGTPYLSGSSLKGLARTWARDWDGADEATLRRIFGPETHAGALEVGSVIFMDAVPTAPVRLKVEVMTPHYGDYYQNGADPGDWHSPVPIQFLAVAPGASFWIGVMPRRPENQADATRAMAWLEEALDELGAGAKTATGFGRMNKKEITVRIPATPSPQQQGHRTPPTAPAAPAAAAKATVRQAPEPEAINPFAAALKKAEEEKARKSKKK